MVVPSLDLMVLDVHYPVLVRLDHHILKTVGSSGIVDSSAAGSTAVEAGTCSSPDVDAPLLR